MWHKLLYPILLALFFNSCGNDKGANKKVIKSQAERLVKYAKRFDILKEDGVYIVHVYDSENKPSATFVIAADTGGLRKKYHASEIVKSPCKKIAALSSIYASAFYELGSLDNIIAIDNIDYVVNTDIINRYKAGKIEELAKTPDLDLEKTIRLAPDVVFSFGMGAKNTIDKRLLQSGIPTAVSFDHLEENPLARAEWIKFYAAFVGRFNQADSIFSAVEKNYLHLKNLALATTLKPTVFSEIKYSEFWYMPGGKSYVARLLSDAGANYLWNDNDDIGSLPLSFEQVYSKALKADYWINLSTHKKKKELESYDTRYSNFKAYQTGNLYNNTKHINSLGYSDYWETGMMHPDRILSDLLQIFHPELKPVIKNELYYYEQLN